MTMIICGKDCEDCIHCTAIDDENPGRIKVYCDYTDRWRWFGQCIDCENKIKQEKERQD